ncbi:Uncharacterized protein PECH_003759 [Penicillium ucsense]|uniref:Uncharacterized protein n=1 Tax=Penicillium ucsense TaxID=2839758 RepID=A0A8J8VVY8_9EURO|nr:Uncharacterized protein PECM_003164 [Penicillium ucsense]KAF7729184.1 Uncharacterized protein PECH_003759 [Penicillium ucsense]
MAIFDSEKRPRGLRVPSLTAMKMGSAATKSQLFSHSKKSYETSATATSPPTSVTSPLLVSPADLYSKVPPPPPTKELPPTPREDLPQPAHPAQPVQPLQSVQPVKSATTQLSSTPSTVMPARREVLRKPPPNSAVPMAGANKNGLRQASQQSPSEQPQHQPQSSPPSKSPLQTRPMPSHPAYNAPRPSQRSAQQPQPPQAQASAPTQQYHAQSMPVPYLNHTASGPVTHQPRAVQPPVQASQGPVSPPETIVQATSPADGNTTSSTPSNVTTPPEERIHTPEEGSASLDPTSSDDQTSLSTPSDDLDILPATLGKVHYNCFQEHRNMPVAQNSWCPGEVVGGVDEQSQLSNVDATGPPRGA